MQQTKACSFFPPNFLPQTQPGRGADGLYTLTGIMPKWLVFLGNASDLCFMQVASKQPTIL